MGAGRQIVGRAAAGTAALVAALVVAACGAAEPNPTAAQRLGDHGLSRSTSTHGTSSGHGAPSTPAPRTPLRAGETRQSVAAPAAYTPTAPNGGTDDYRCFLLDPRLAKDTFVTGFDVAPGVPTQVHHVILYRVPPKAAARARAQEASTPGDGWTCFGGTGLESRGAGLDDAPWVGAWAPGGGEQVLDPDVGIPLDKGSLLVMQVHYNLLAGAAPDRTAVDLRFSSSRKLAALETSLFPGPVELPCRPGKSGPLCDRETAIRDVMTRFGEPSGRMVAGLLFICRGTFLPTPGSTQTCSRPVSEPSTVRTAAGHMHLLGSALRIELNPGTARARTLLDIPQWDFDDQGSVPVPPTKVGPGDTIRVTCTHDQSWRDRLPALQGIPERYVVWGEGTTDEMCLGILGVTRP